VNRRFQAKRAKDSNCHIIKIVAVIPVFTVTNDLQVLFADDLKLFNLIESPDPHTMQDALNRLFKWAETWQLGISY